MKAVTRCRVGYGGLPQLRQTRCTRVAVHLDRRVGGPCCAKPAYPLLSAVSDGGSRARVAIPPAPAERTPPSTTATLAEVAVPVAGVAAAARAAPVAVAAAP